MKYCEDCKYLTGKIYTGNRGVLMTFIDGWWCGFYTWREIDNKHLRETPFVYKKKKTEKYFAGLSKNKEGNCPNYKRKWWKFWRKK